MRSVKVGIAGLGTVGSGTVKVLCENAAEIARRVGCPIEVAHIGARSNRLGCETGQIKISQDIFDLLQNQDLNIFVELIGGTTTAREWVLAALATGKPVVTANKALIAEHGSELLAKAKTHKTYVLFEAAVAGGIPIIKTLREGLAANKIEWIAGIINGTGNFILSEMLKDREFSEVLIEAQSLGYAEADPTFDVEGTDAAHKLTILAAIAFGMPLSFDKVYTEGISRLSSLDLLYADTLGFRIKHLGLACRTAEGVELRVHPTLIPKKNLLAKVDGVMNAVMVKGNALGPSLYYGAGAGSLATASAVVADIVDLARAVVSKGAYRIPFLAYEHLSDVPVLPITRVRSAYYLRVQVQEQPGVLAHVAQVLSGFEISIEAILQKSVHSQTGLVSIIILTQPVLESDLNEAIRKIEALAETGAPVIRIRVETLSE